MTRARGTALALAVALAALAASSCELQEARDDDPVVDSEWKPVNPVRAPADRDKDMPHRARPDELPALVKCLRAPEARVRVDACWSIASLGPEAAPAVRALRRLLDGVQRSPDEVDGAMFALGAIGPEAGEAAREIAWWLAEREHGYWAQSALGKIGEPAVPALRDVVRGGPPEALPGALAALAAIGPPAIAAEAEVRPIVEREKGPAEVRAAAAACLGRIGAPADEELRARLALLLAGGTPHEKAAAASALAGCQGDRASSVGPLVDALADGEADVRRAAALALGAIGAPARGATGRLAQAGSRDGPDALAALDALGEIGGLEAITALRRALAEANAARTAPQQPGDEARRAGATERAKHAQAALAKAGA